MANLFNLHEFPVIILEKSPVSTSSSFSKEAQRKGAKEIHKYFMAKRSLNKSRKSTIQKVVALTAHSKSSEHSSSSSEHKSSNGSKRSDKSTPDPFVYSNSDSDEDEAAANKNSVNSNEKLVKVLVQKQTEKKKNATVKKIHLLPPSVQKAPRQVPTSHHAKSYQKVPSSPHGKPPHMKRRFQQMHTCQGKNQCVFVIKLCCTITKTQFNHKGISGEKVAVLFKGADPTEEA
ncbi:hypothetical protein Taro_012933 [Colocasia esculenta]|uniref:Uncharacterized protein n=1 Tax=Colocasia esculenta TaxID=4460 RepID=A0A843UH80_COLES|nr:hypothetical protein [Colocasia esculenta]